MGWLYLPYSRRIACYLLVGAPPQRAHGWGSIGTRLSRAALDFFSAKRRTSWLTMTASISPSYVAGCRRGAVPPQIFGESFWMGCQTIPLDLARESMLIGKHSFLLVDAKTQSRYLVFQCCYWQWWLGSSKCLGLVPSLGQAGANFLKNVVLL